MPGSPSDEDPDRPKSVDGPASREPGFAELLSDVRPIDGGPERVSPARKRAGGPERVRPARRRPDAPGSVSRNASPPAAFRWPDAADRHRAAAPGVSDAVLLRLTRGEPAPEERIDLHGVRQERVAALLERRFASARSSGLRCVLVIHGRGRRSAGGESVLRDRMPEWLSRGPVSAHVIAFASAPERLGGAGATLVRLRKR